MQQDTLKRLYVSDRLHGVDTAAASSHSHARRVLSLRSLQAATVPCVYQSKLPSARTLLIYIQDVSCSNIGRDTDYRDRFYFPCFPQSPQAVMPLMLACWHICSLMRLVWVGAIKWEDRPSVGDVRFTAYGGEHDGTLYCCVLWVFVAAKEPFVSAWTKWQNLFASWWPHQPGDHITVRRSCSTFRRLTSTIVDVPHR